MTTGLRGLVGALVVAGVAVGCATAGPPEAALPAGVAGFASTQGKAPALDGTTAGWERAPVSTFALEANSVTVQGMYDADNIYIRWVLQKDWEVVVTPLDDPIRLFTHDKIRDTLSLYLQGDTGDMRLVFAPVTDDANKPMAVVLGTFPSWHKPGAQPVEYWSPVRTEQMAHAVIIEKAELAFTLEDEKRRMILVARVPVSELNFKGTITRGFRTRGDFEATLGGSQKFWWSGNNEFGATFVTDEPSEATLYQKGWKAIWFLEP